MKSERTAKSDKRYREREKKREGEEERERERERDTKLGSTGYLLDSIMIMMFQLKTLEFAHNCYCSRNFFLLGETQTPAQSTAILSRGKMSPQRVSWYGLNQSNYEAPINDGGLENPEYPNICHRSQVYSSPEGYHHQEKVGRLFSESAFVVLNFVIWLIRNIV